MDREEIEALEPKYTGNEKHLTEGEAAGIVNDPANQLADEEDNAFGVLAAAGLYVANWKDVPNKP
ncbi:MAG: hypothetical protein J7639_19435 [Paenibacillaceae bacterium]|uniref:hypothetical protein n=1 Tax=Paenibacillus cymbidii TaxID=1639034 RepID=UPI00108227C3|nr:hypothetical protein [Paenibacillus cymbidii]MBO9608143.1 hypothetical protein [Paenibacillaceae bacterium]